MDTWGTRGFSAAAIAGGALGLSGATPAVPAVGSSRRPAGRHVAGPAGPTRPDPALARPAARMLEDYRSAEQTMISPLLSHPAPEHRDEPPARHRVPARHGIGGFGTGGSGPHDSDGFLAVPRTAADVVSDRYDLPGRRRMGLLASHPAERSVRSAELVGARPAGHRDPSALGSLDHSDLFDTLSNR